MHLRARSRKPCSPTAFPPSSIASKRPESYPFPPIATIGNTRTLTSNHHNPPGGHVRLQSSRALRNQFFNSPSFGDLTNPIHPIFRADNFLDGSIQYPTIENSLRLASRFITTDQLLPFWHALLCGAIETTNKPHLPPSQALTTLTESQRKEVISKLELLASCVSFTSERNWTRGDTGYTERLLLDAPLPFQGVKTIISISKRVFRMIELSYLKPRMENESRLWTQFLLVNLLLHELAHAAMYAAHPRPPAHDPIQAYFLPGARTTEEGMEWETFVFGGLLYDIPSFFFTGQYNNKLGSKIVLREWPSPRLVASYRKNIYPRPFPVKGSLPEHDRVWLVPAEFFERLFTTGFWEKVVPNQGTKALRPMLEECFVSRGVLGRLVPHADGDVR